jgi:hypothetical protein
MKACMLWEKDTARHNDELKLDPLGQTAKDFGVNAVSGGGSKVIVNAVIPNPTYPNDSKNLELRKRHKKIVDSNVIMLMDRLHLDLFQQEKCFPNRVDIRLRFNHSRPQFYMMTDPRSSAKMVI